jgi:hypothetical protein
MYSIVHLHHQQQQQQRQQFILLRYREQSRWRNTCIARASCRYEAAAAAAAVRCCSLALDMPGVHSFVFLLLLLLLLPLLLPLLCCQEGERYDLEFEWSSPLSGRAGRFFRLNGLKKEQGMVRKRHADRVDML